jgi:hypothetical protein
MKKILTIIYTALFLFNFLSCEKIKKENNELNFEKNVFKDILPLLTEQIKGDTRKEIRPTPPMPILDENGNIIEIDSTVYFESLIKHEKTLSELKKNKSKLVVAINDSVFNLKKEDWKSFKTHLLLKKEKKYDSIQENKISYKLNISELKKDSILEFKYLSEFPKGTNIWKAKYSFHLNGTMSFSRIYFSKNKKFGMLVYSILKGKLSGGIMRCFIKKENENWKIEKEELLKVS